MSKSKILVFHLKEIIYTLLFILLGILLILLFIFMFFPGKKQNENKAHPSAAVSYTPGTYHSSLTIHDSPLEVSVTVSEHKIEDISIENQSEIIATMYPLFDSSSKELCKQIVKKQSTSNLEYPEEQKYTYGALIQAINDALNQASVQ